ncbi:2-oxo acid dehydrogenase subunit E2 [Microlunatus ginsengisoli]|uniref:2-oxoacid dehydrogenase acyltransferase catalytic domain-containing protein n=1 Tax=Microlunatus ginsengisoli TaxID=363863 RepID=A0ABP7AYW9_9ACTN
MDRQPPSYETRPFLKIRRAYGDLLAASRTKDVIHGLVEIDVTDARQAIAQTRAAGHDVSFTAYLLYVIGRAIDQDPTLHAYRRRNRLIIFDDVDANTQIEATVNGQPIVKSVIIRAINHQSVEELTATIRTAQRTQPELDRRYRWSLAYLNLPQPVRRLVWRVLLRRPDLFKLLGGTIAVSSVGMFGPAGGWGIPVTPATLTITVGGLVTKPCYVDDRLQPRELLDITISVDHAIVDGAPAARFARRLSTQIDDCAGLQPARVQT